jgi:hypothetical protein
MMNKTRILIPMAGIFFLLALSYSKAEPDYVWVTEDKYDHISSILFTADSNYIVINGRKVNSTEQCYTIIDVDNGKVAKEVIGEGHIFAFTKDGRYAYSYKDIKNQVCKLYKLSASTMTILDSINIREYILDILGYGLSVDEQRIFLSGGQVWQGVGYNFLVIDVPSFSVITVTQLSNSLSQQLVVSPANDYFAILNYYLYGDASHSWGETKVELYNAQTLELVKSFKLEKEYNLREMQFSNDGRYFAYIIKSTDKTINDELLVYNVQNQLKLVNHIKVEQLGQSSLTSLNFSNDNRYLYISSGSLVLSKYIKFLHKLEIGTNNFACIHDLTETEVALGKLILTLNEQYLITTSQRLSNHGDLVMINNPCKTPTNIKETIDNNGDIKTLAVIDNKISIPIENHVITNPINWQIHDIIGNQVLSGIEHSVTNELQIDVSILPSGTYFLTLQFEKETVNYKFIRVK